MSTYAGAWPVMVTPYDNNLRIDYDVYRTMIKWYLAHNIGGLYANCLSSEMYLLDETERLGLVIEAVKSAGGRVPVAATGNLGNTLDEHIAFCRRVAGAGADVVMLLVPEFHDNDDDLERYYLTLAENVQAPLGLYECPVPRPYHLSAELVRRLGQTGRFAAYKETSCDLSKIQALVSATAGTPFSILPANTPYLLDAIGAGASGAMSIASIWLPDLVGTVIAEGIAGKPDAERLHAHLCMMEMAERAVHPLGLKHLLRKRGVSIAPSTRRTSYKPCSPEALRALDYCAEMWFTPGGELRLLHKQ
ncbi:MAG: dihydrodipicolinate synthase family protein [bacterium]|nr:dihydrodipicolinate synthase family protein [bacterium]